MNEGQREHMLARVELAASVSWLFMDFAWMEERTLWATLFSLPTMLCALAAIVLARPDFAARAVTAAMASWAVMNSFWMFADLSVYRGLWVARSCFFLGGALLGCAWLASGSATGVMRELLSAFRRLRSHLGG
jgi:hypothetical protein